jgi:putative DNA primase/helicase
MPLRVANRFALAAFGGELATRRGITGWEEGEATKAAGTLFREWLTGRGTIGNSDEEAAIRQVRAFIEAHGASRFQSMSGDNERINNRAGYKASQGGEVTYYIFPEVFRSEVCRGFDAQLVIKAMDNRRLLLRERADTYTYRLKTPEGRFPFYALNTKILSEK